MENRTHDPANSSLKSATRKIDLNFYENGLFSFEVRDQSPRGNAYRFALRDETEDGHREFVADVMSEQTGHLVLALSDDEVRQLAETIERRFNPVPAPSGKVYEVTGKAFGLGPVGRAPAPTRWTSVGDAERLEFEVNQQKTPGDNYTFSLRERDYDYPDRFEAMVSYPAQMGEVGLISIGLTEEEVRQLGEALQQQFLIMAKPRERGASFDLPDPLAHLQGLASMLVITQGMDPVGAEQAVATDHDFKDWAELKRQKPAVLRLAIVMAQIPELSDYAYVGHFPSVPHETREETLQRLRQQLRASAKQVDEAAAWLKKHVAADSETNLDANTFYGMKHALEDAVGYLTNGVLVAAALVAGYRYEIGEDTGRVYFAISDSTVTQAIDQYWKRAEQALSNLN